MDQLFTLLLAGLCTVASRVPRQYRFVNENKTWAEAQSYCRQHYTDLASYDNMEDIIKANNIVDKGYWVWIGLYKNSTSWSWSLEDSDFYSEGERAFTNWDSEEPSNTEGREECAQIWPSGKWNDMSCSTQLPFVCYEEKNGRESYILIDVAGGKNWTAAQSYCRENHTDLASVRNKTENDLIMGMAVNGPWIGGPWIGLCRNCWRWSDQRGSSFRYWKAGKPDNAKGAEHCAVQWLRQGYAGSWDDRRCDEKHPFVCYEED